VEKISKMAVRPFAEGGGQGVKGQCWKSFLATERRYSKMTTFVEKKGNIGKIKMESNTGPTLSWLSLRGTLFGQGKCSQHSLLFSGNPS
jgi:hypothetical protein